MHPSLEHRSPECLHIGPYIDSLRDLRPAEGKDGILAVRDQKSLCIRLWGIELANQLKAAAFEFFDQQVSCLASLLETFIDQLRHGCHHPGGAVRVCRAGNGRVEQQIVRCKIFFGGSQVPRW
jgi:hypothetical protein